MTLTADHRAAITERCNEAALWAPDVVRALRYGDEDLAVDAMRQFLRLNEAMRIQLELCGIKAPEIQFVDTEAD